MFNKKENINYDEVPLAAGMNFDLEQVQPFLKRLSSSVLDSGFTAEEINTIDAQIEKMNKDNEIKEIGTFNVIYKGKQAEIRIEAEIHIEDVTQHSISFSWDKMFEGSEGSYLVIVDGEYTGEEEPLPASETSYELTDLEPDTTYLIEVYGESDEFGNIASIEVTTLPEDEEGMKQAELYLINEDEQPISEAEFLIEGLDENNEDVLFEGFSDENGQLIDDLQADEGKFSLKAGAYSLFVYSEGIEYEYEFTIEEEQD